jgi:hypothetical protein
MTYCGYPVVEERVLDRTRRRLLLGGRREPGELPTQPPGSVLVFEVAGRFEVLRERRHLSGREETVVDAVGVSVVDMRERLVTVDVLVPSASAADDFTIRALFRCRVTQPEVVAAAGITDLTGVLGGHIGQDRELASRCASYTVDAIREIREWATARVTAFCKVQPPRINGMSIWLAEVHVLTPKDLRAHATGMRDEAWRQDLEDLRQAFENRDVDRIETIFRRGPAAISALAASRGQLNLGEAVEQAYRAEEMRTRSEIEAVKALVDGGHLDTAPIDGMRYVDALAERIFGGRVDGADGVAGATPKASIAAGDGEQDGPRVVDEEELSG